MERAEASRGAEAHELVVVRADAIQELPTEENGAVVKTEPDGTLESRFAEGMAPEVRVTG